VQVVTHMIAEVRHLNIAARTLTFVNREGLYPVNQYQSLVLATASEVAALLVASRRGCAVEELSGWEPCCGGGPAAVALKCLGLRYVQATDINENAVASCIANASRNEVTLDRVTRASMLEDGSDRCFDLIACNPPCGVGDMEGSDSELDLAVKGGPDGTDVTQHLLSQAVARLTPGGSLIFVAVSTGHVRRLGSWLDEIFPGRWRTFPFTPVAAPYARVGDLKLQSLADPSLSFRPMVWERPDGWYWRLSWIVEVTTGGAFFSSEAGSSDPHSGFAMCPFGYEVSQDAALGALIKEVTKDGFWLAYPV
jgi:hypothetical protein